MWNGTRGKGEWIRGIRECSRSILSTDIICMYENGTMRYIAKSKNVHAGAFSYGIGVSLGIDIIKIKGKILDDWQGD